MADSGLTKRLVFFISLSILWELSFSARCVQKGLCTCDFDDGSGTLDITSLGKTDNTPRFKDIKDDKEGNFYSYNPCQPFDENDCTGAAVCILNSDHSESIVIGEPQSAAFQQDTETGDMIAGYTAGTIGNLRLSEIILKCDEDACEPEIKADGQQSGGFFQMTLKTVCACPNGCDANGPKNCKNDAGMSGGVIFIIIVCSLGIVYLVGGAVFMKFVQKKEGMEIIPNVSFWKSLPGNIKGGFLFLWNKIRRKETKYDGI
ncbi:mannose transmembrane transporter [Mactra antiquata]